MFAGIYSRGAGRGRLIAPQGPVASSLIDLGLSLGLGLGLVVIVGCGQLEAETTLSTEITGVEPISPTTSTTTDVSAGAAETGETDDTEDMSTSTTTMTTTTTTTTTGEPSGYCGDKIVQEDEECDDGSGNSDKAGCTSECRLNVCGDGLKWIGEEQCDLGEENDNSWKCTEECVRNVCGDGYRLVGIEACDLGEDNSDEGECTTDCTKNVCGDGYTLKGFEECDDGTFKNGDGCSIDCRREQAVFVTKDAFTGDLGGVAGADAKCQEAAKLGGLLPWASDDFTYKAWIADPDCPPKHRFPHSSRPYRRTDGIEMALNYDDLVDGTIIAANVCTEGWEYYLDVDLPVWTAVTPDGSNGSNLASTTCNFWTIQGDFFFGSIGNGRFLHGGWTQWILGGDWVGRGCHRPAHLYCVQIDCLAYPDYCEPDYCAA